MSLNRRRFICTLTAAATAAHQLLRVTQRSQRGINVIDTFGFVPDGSSDNYAAFHRWAAHVNRNRGGNYVFPPGTYAVHQHRTQSLARRDPRTVINPLIDGADGLTISGYGVKIVLNGAFHRSARLGPDGQPQGRNFAIFMPFEIHRSRNVAVRGFEIDGGVRAMTRDKEMGESYAHLIALHGCSDVILEDLDLHHCQTDGVYLTSSELDGRPGIACRGVTLRRVNSHNNARGGMGVIQVYGLLAEDCSFDGNGEDLGRYAPHAPRFGVDVEPDYHRRDEVDILTGNIEFRRCQFFDNSSALLAGYGDQYQGYLRVIDCRSSNSNGGIHHMIISWAGALIEGGMHDAGTGSISLSWQGQRGSNVTMRNCEVRAGGLYGIMHGNAGNVVALEGVRLVGTQRQPGTHGSLLLIDSDPGAGRRNRMRGCDIFVPARRKSRDHLYDYEITLNHVLSEDNLFRTDLPATDGQHFCTDYGPRTVARRDRYRGTAPGPTDSFRPARMSGHDTRQPFSKG